MGFFVTTLDEHVIKVLMEKKLVSSKNDKTSSSHTRLRKNLRMNSRPVQNIDICWWEFIVLQFNLFLSKYKKQLKRQKMYSVFVSRIQKVSQTPTMNLHMKVRSQRDLQQTWEESTLNRNLLHRVSPTHTYSIRYSLFLCKTALNSALT